MPTKPTYELIREKLQLRESIFFGTFWKCELDTDVYVLSRQTAAGIRHITGFSAGGGDGLEGFVTDRSGVVQCRCLVSRHCF